MSRLKRLEEIAQEFRKHLQVVVTEEKFLNDGEMIELSISVKLAPSQVSSFVNDHTQVPAKNEILEKSIEGIGFSTATVNCLDFAGIKTIVDLVKKSARELSEIRNFGKVKLNEVRVKLTEHNLKLKGD